MGSDIGMWGGFIPAPERPAGYPNEARRRAAMDVMNVHAINMGMGNPVHWYARCVPFWASIPAAEWDAYQRGRRGEVGEDAPTS